LGDAERMFFVSLLLNQVVGWVRAQTGTSSLRAIVFMDEIAGYFPPVANPPSKAPLLTLLKQARAFGVGVVLATQNPVDLDYKGLSNIGTWFIGRLQTERDKARMLDGLEGAAAGALDRSDADRILSVLPKRVFLLHNVHQPKPMVFQTRWTMSYLRGPMSREQLARIRGPVSASPVSASPVSGSPVAGSSVAGSAAGAKPVLPPEINQYFIPGPASVYSPVIVGAARVSFTDPKLGVQESRDVVYAAPIESGPVPVDWQTAERIEVAPADLRHDPSSPDAKYEPVPPAAQQKRNYAAWQKSFSQSLSQTERLELFRHRATKLTSTGGESERDFVARVQDTRRAARDADVEAIRRKFGPKRDTLAERLRKAEAAVEREQQQASEHKTQTMLSVGAAAIGALFGRKAMSSGTLGRATTAARGMGRSMKEAGDVKRANETVEAVREQLEAFDAMVLEQTQEVAAKYDVPVDIERVPLTPKRGQIEVQFVALGWRPR
jgi:hypothetical protein